MPRNNESIGVAAEVAIAHAFNVQINSEYERRAENSIVEMLDCETIRGIFSGKGIPKPTAHIAEGQNPVDFMLEGGKTLSVKTNMGKQYKVAPQNIGQPTAETYFEFIEQHNILPGFTLKKCLQECNLQDTYESRVAIFKCISQREIVHMLNMYWDNLFECDYLIHFFIVRNSKKLNNNYIVIPKPKGHPRWDSSKISFSKTISEWNESCTLEYDGITIGEFQAHRNRNCLKFRFDLRGLMRLIEERKI